MSSDPGLDDTAAPEPEQRAATGEPGTEDTLASDRPQLEKWLRARIDARLFGGAHAKIGRFEVLGTIGAGGMSVVCRARDPDLDREVAIKLLQGGAALGDHGRARLQREARAMAKLAHPNVATVFEVGVHEGEVFVAMELVPGQTLREWSAAHAGEHAAILSTYLAAGEGLAAAHAAGFVHRDFKPDNVIVGSDDRPRVLDFGLAAVLGESMVERGGGTTSEADRQGSLTMTGTVLGTPAYMAPEQHRGHATDERSDQFAFCVSLWEALGEARPFTGRTIGELAAAVQDGHITPPPRPIAARIEAVLRRGLAVDPAARFASMRALLDALAQARRRDPRWIAAAAIVGVVALGTGVYVLANRDRDPPPPPPSIDEAAIAIPPIAPPPMPEKPVETVELTRTPGRGIDTDGLFMDAAAQRVVYRAGDELWLRDVDAQAPAPLPWKYRDYEPFAFDEASGGWLAMDGESIWRVRPEGEPERLAFAPRPLHATQIMSRDHDTVVLFDRAGNSLQRAGAPPISVLAGQHIVFADFAHDRRRWAAVAVPEDGLDTTLYVLDMDGNVLHRRALPELVTESLVWLGETIAMIDMVDGPVNISCFAVGDDEIAAPVVHTIDLPRDVKGSAMQGSAGGDLLLLVAQTYRDVAILPLADGREAELVQLSPDLRASNRSPTWIDDRRLAFVSDRFGGDAVMTDERTGGHARPDARFEGRADACAVAGDAILCAMTHDDGTRTIVRADGEAPARTLGPAGEITDIMCANESTCIGLTVPATAESEIYGLDPQTGELTRRFACPRQLLCVVERVALAPDGRSIIVADGRAVHRLDAMTGADLAPELVVASDSTIIQSAIELPGGDIVTTQMVGQGESSHYAVVRSRDGVHRTLWQSADRWVIRPRASPDGSQLALTSMSFHFEAALARDPCGVKR